MFVITITDYQTVLKSASGGHKYVRRWYQNGRWNYEYHADLPVRERSGVSTSHVSHVHKEPHTVEVSETYDTPEKAYHAAHKKSDAFHAVLGPQGKVHHYVRYSSGAHPSKAYNVVDVDEKGIARGKARRLSGKGYEKLYTTAKTYGHPETKEYAGPSGETAFRIVALPPNQAAKFRLEIKPSAAPGFTQDKARSGKNKEWVFKYRNDLDAAQNEIQEYLRLQQSKQSHASKPFRPYEGKSSVAVVSPETNPITAEIEAGKAFYRYGKRKEFRGRGGVFDRDQLLLVLPERKLREYLNEPRTKAAFNRAMGNVLRRFGIDRSQMTHDDRQDLRAVFMETTERALHRYTPVDGVPLDAYVQSNIEQRAIQTANVIADRIHTQERQKHLVSDDTGASFEKQPTGTITAAVPLSKQQRVLELHKWKRTQAELVSRKIANLQHMPIEERNAVLKKELQRINDAKDLKEAKRVYESQQSNSTLRVSGNEPRSYYIATHIQQQVANAGLSAEDKVIEQQKRAAEQKASKKLLDMLPKLVENLPGDFEKQAMKKVIGGVLSGDQSVFARVAKEMLPQFRQMQEYANISEGEATKKLQLMATDFVQKLARNPQARAVLMEARAAKSYYDVLQVVGKENELKKRYG